MSCGSELFEEDERPQDYSLEEFGKLKLQYCPYKVGVFSGSGGVTYVVMLAHLELIVFIIQAVFKQPNSPQNVNRNRAGAFPTTGPTDIIGQLDEIADETEQVENFKMARRCTIPLPYNKPKLLESYAAYFIVGGYEEQPFQIDVYERNKTNVLSVKIDQELKRVCRMKSLQQKEVRSLTRVLVPRLRWSDRLSERLESRRRLPDQSGKTKTEIGLRQILFIGNCSNPSYGS